MGTQILITFTDIFKPSKSPVISSIQYFEKLMRGYRKKWVDTRLDLLPWLGETVRQERGALWPAP